MWIEHHLYAVQPARSDSGKRTLYIDLSRNCYKYKREYVWSATSCKGGTYRSLHEGLGGRDSMTQLPGAQKIRDLGCGSIEESARIANPGTGTKGQEPVLLLSTLMLNSTSK